MVHSILLIGQSNAAGRGFISEAEPLDTCGGKLKVLRNGKWLGMYRPVNGDRPFSGTCFAESFAKAYYTDNPEVEVGIIPCADGGTSLDQWQPGEVLFDNAVNCAKLAMRTSCLVAVLWHQGEADCPKDKYPLYSQKFKIIVDTLRKELGIPNLPVITGGLGDFLPNFAPDEENLVNYDYINQALIQFAQTEPHCAFASAKGLGSNPDNLHFNAKALDEFGLRYYEEYKKIKTPTEQYQTLNSDFDTKRTAMEQL